MAARTTETILPMVFPMFFGRPDKSLVNQVLVGLQTRSSKGDALARKAHHGAHFILLIKLYVLRIVWFGSRSAGGNFAGAAT
jgi:hypothetical protein